MRKEGRERVEPRPRPTVCRISGEWGGFLKERSEVRESHQASVRADLRVDRLVVNDVISRFVVWGLDSMLSCEWENGFSGFQA